MTTGVEIGACLRWKLDTLCDLLLGHIAIHINPLGSHDLIDLFLGRFNTWLRYDTLTITQVGSFLFGCTH